MLVHLVMDITTGVQGLCCVPAIEPDRLSCSWTHLCCSAILREIKGSKNGSGNILIAFLYQLPHSASRWWNGGGGSGYDEAS